MGLFDDLTCELPLEDLPEWCDGNFQTKDTPAQWMDEYRIDAEGRLWHREYDYEDRSDPDAEGLMAIAGMLTRVNKRWVRDDHFDGVIDFYDFDYEGTREHVDYHCVFIDGKIVKGPTRVYRDDADEESAVVVADGRQSGTNQEITE